MVCPIFTVNSCFLLAFFFLSFLFFLFFLYLLFYLFHVGGGKVWNKKVASFKHSLLPFNCSGGTLRRTKQRKWRERKERYEQRDYIVCVRERGRDKEKGREILPTPEEIMPMKKVCSINQRGTYCCCCCCCYFFGKEKVFLSVKQSVNSEWTNA